MCAEGHTGAETIDICQFIRNSCGLILLFREEAYYLFDRRMNEMFNVVVVDRDPMIRDILKNYVSQVNGFQITAETDLAEEAEKLTLSGRIQLVVGELQLQDHNLLEKIIEMRTRRRPVDYIAVTSDQSYGTWWRARQYGAVDYIVKPFSRARLHESLIRYRAMREKLTPETPVTQELLDHLRFGQPDSLLTDGGAAPDTFARCTYERIVAYSREHSNDFFLAEDMAKDLGITASTGRKYLLKLAEEGLIALEPLYGRRGRPRQRFRYTGVR